MSTHNLCFEQKYEKYQSFLPENFPFLEVKFSLYLNRRVFVMTVHDDFTVYTCKKMWTKMYGQILLQQKKEHLLPF